jgi:hypothetical protein
LGFNEFDAALFEDFIFFGFGFLLTEFFLFSEVHELPIYLDVFLRFLDILGVSLGFLDVLFKLVFGIYVWVWSGEG